MENQEHLALHNPLCLCITERTTHLLCLTGVLKWKKPALTPYCKPLLQLVEKTSKTKDVMVSFSLDPTTSIVALEHRPVLLQMVARLALGR